MSKPDKDEEALVELTRTALADVLGREPSRQEVWKVHAGFKRMAFMLLDHMDHIKKHENENPDQETYPEDLETDHEEAADEAGTSLETGELLRNFTIRELENPTIRRDFCRAMDNIDRALPKSREW